MGPDNIQLIDYWLQSKHKESAKPLLLEILQNNPHDIPAAQRLALFWPKEALKILLEVVGTSNCPPAIKMIVGDLYLEQGNPQDAIGYYLSLLSSSQPFFELLHNLGLAYAKIYRFKDAVSQFEKAAHFQPNSFELHVNWGAALKNLGRHHESLEHLIKAEKLDPLDARIWLNKGVTLEALNQLEQAIECYEIALKLDPNYLEAYCNKANALMAMGNYDDAFSNFQKALSINRDDPDTLYNLSFLQLGLGNYEEGWKNYENRWRRENAPPKPFEQIEPLVNLDAIQGKNILVWSEQGLGDSIQFCRFIPHLAKMGASVSLATHSELMEIMSTVEGIKELLPQENNVVGVFDAQIPLLSLPLLFQNAKIPFPNNFPYVKSNPNKVSWWEQRLKFENQIKVGLVWSGGFRSDQPELWAVNARRNIAFSVIARLRDIPGIQFISLQKGEPAETELITTRPMIWPNDNLSLFSSDLNSFEDTAALIQNLDLVISVDTSTAHLAGALGKPVWILNRYDSCWRWLRQEQKSHWYPRLQLFNQPNPGNWDAVIRDVHAKLQKIASSKDMKAL